MTQETDPISFHIEEVDGFQLEEIVRIKEWIQAAFSEENNQISFLNCIFCNDNYLHKLNIEYINHDTLTDVITFPYSKAGKPIEGDIFISIDRIKENAIKFDVPFDQELRRVIIHGCLHLMGYTDKSEKDKLKIRQKEDHYLSVF